MDENITGSILFFKETIAFLAIEPPFEPFVP
jgi:hypothetical protein